jgi:small-conductance mechanosensitive channel
MSFINDILTDVGPYLDTIYFFIVVIFVFVVFSIILRIIKRVLLSKVSRKKQISNVVTFLSLLKFLFAILLFIIIIFAYYRSWGDIGFVMGLLTVALGMALQKPITGVFAWLIIISRKQFSIGDRVIISNIKGDITNITLTHIHLEEVGGTIDGEEKSNRTIIMPTSIIFEKEIINYNEKDDIILDEVTVSITYESNLEMAEKIMNSAVKTVMTPLWNNFSKKKLIGSHIRLKTKDSGLDITVRYHTLAMKRNSIATDIIREILKHIRKTKDTQVLLPESKKKSKNIIKYFEF